MVLLPSRLRLLPSRPALLCNASGAPALWAEGSSRGEAVRLEEKERWLWAPSIPSYSRNGPLGPCCARCASTARAFATQPPARACSLWCLARVPRQLARPTTACPPLPPPALPPPAHPYHRLPALPPPARPYHRLPTLTTAQLTSVRSRWRVTGDRLRRGEPSHPSRVVVRTPPPRPAAPPLVCFPPLRARTLARAPGGLASSADSAADGRGQRHPRAERTGADHRRACRRGGAFRSPE